MRAVRLHEHGGPGVLHVEDVEVPEPGPTDARVRVEAAGVNFIDTYQREGAYETELPATLGLEGAGVVDAVGHAVTDLTAGERVAWAMTPGSYAEHVVVPAEMLAPVPEGVTTEQAAAVMLQGMTAHYLTHDTWSLAEGDTALVHAAAGGVGHLLVQVAKLRGARVIGTTSTEEKAELVRAAGADEVIRYDQADVDVEVARLTERGVDVVYDGVGHATFAQGLNCLRPRGMMALFGQSSGPVDPINPQVLNAKGSLFLTRPSLAHYAADAAERRWRAGDLFDWIAGGRLEVRIDRTWPLEDAGEAQRYMEERRTRGKVLLSPSSLE